jgi:hypothetical protein
MLFRLGIATAYNASHRKPLNRTIYIYGEFIAKFRDVVGFISDFKKDRIASVRSTPSSRMMIPVAEKWIETNKKYFDTKQTHNNAKIRKAISRRTCRLMQESGCTDAIDMLSWFHTKIDKIEKVQSASVCLEVPEYHKFMQNGLPWGNSQGSEFDKVLVIDEQCDLWEPARWRYTAVTRAAEQLRIVI